MVPAEISLSTELGKEKLLAQVRSWVEGWVKKRFPEDYPNRKVEVEYRRRAEFLTTQIDPTAGLAVRIAALTHGIERVSPYLKHETEHSARWAESVAELLSGFGLPERFAIDTARLVQTYETGGDRRSEIVRGAVGIAFLEVKAPFLISSASEEKTLQELNNKIGLIYDRIWIFEAKEMAEEPYEKAIAQLEKKRREMKSLEEEGRQALKEYWQLVEKCKFSIGLSEKKIDALREAGDKALLLGEKLR